MKKVNAEKSLHEVVNGIVTFLKETKDFVKSQAPDVVKQLINYKLASTALSIVICLSLMGVLGYLGHFIFNIEDMAGRTFLFVFLIAAEIEFAFELFSSFNDLLKLLIAPKVFVIEYLKDLVTQNGDSEE